MRKNPKIAAPSDGMMQYLRALGVIILENFQFAGSVEGSGKNVYKNMHTIAAAAASAVVGMAEGRRVRIFAQEGEREECFDSPHSLSNVCFGSFRDESLTRRRR